MMDGHEHSADPGRRQGTAGTRRPDGSPIRVLVVDDEPTLAELLASVLRYEGWESARRNGTAR